MVRFINSCLSVSLIKFYIPISTKKHVLRHYRGIKYVTFSDSLPGVQDILGSGGTVDRKELVDEKK